MTSPNIEYIGFRINDCTTGSYFVGYGGPKRGHSTMIGSSINHCTATALTIIGNDTGFNFIANRVQGSLTIGNKGVYISGSKGINISNNLFEISEIRFEGPSGINILSNNQFSTSSTVITDNSNTTVVYNNYDYTNNLMMGNKFGVSPVSGSSKWFYLNNIPYLYPNTQGAFGTVLLNDGYGNLAWSSSIGSSSYSLTSSYSLNGGSSGTQLTTGSTYPITSSWSDNSNISNTSLYSSQSQFSVSSSFASGSISSSYSLTASYALNGGGAGISLSTGSSYPITSSWAVSASWAPGGSPSGPIPIQASFDGQGFVVTSGSISYKPISTSGTYTKFVTICDVTGSIIYKIDKFTPTTSSFGAATSLGDITLTDQLYTSSIVSWSVTDTDIVTISLSGSITGITKTSIIIS
jgi:hypothetical protein